MKLVLFGAGGGTGRCVLDQALAAGHDVTAIVRRPAQLAAYDQRVELVAGDVRRPESWTSAMSRADAVLSTIGIGPQRAPTTVYSQGVATILAAMRAAGVRRLAVVSASPAEPREQWKQYGMFRARVLFPILDSRFSATYDDMRRMEQILRGADVDWTSYRPPYLTDRAARGRSRVAINAPLKNASTLARQDLAAVMLDGLSDARHFRTTVEVSR